MDQKEYNDSADKISVDMNSVITTETRPTVRFLLECKRSGILYQNQFRFIWMQIEEQIRCVPPANWTKKEDWQSKGYVGMQSKKSEVALSQMYDILFGSGRWHECITDDGSLDKDAEHLTDLMDILINRSGFNVQSKFWLQEAVDIGTSFLKMMMTEKGFRVVWRSAYQTLIDPYTGHDLEKSRFLIDVYQKDISYIIEEASNPKSMYNKKIIEAFVADAKLTADNLQSQRANMTANAADSYKQLMNIKSIDGTQYITIPAAYAVIDIAEYWAQMPQPDGSYEWKKLTLLNNQYLLCEESNPYGFIPEQWMRLKVRKYDVYGRGYLENGRGMQELMNTCVNLGFDSLKINSMDIVMIDETKVKDMTSIKYKPLAVWKMKDINGAKIQRNPVSAITDVLRGAQMIDQMDQETSGILRSTEGAPASISGGNGDTTLGEYEQKQQAVDKRFLDQARFIEDDALIPFLNKLYKIILNPDLFTQKMVNELLGMDEIDDLSDVVQGDGSVNITKKKKVPKLDLAKIRKESEDGKYHFRCVGATRFNSVAQRQQKYQSLLTTVVQSPPLMALTNLPILYKKTLAAAEFEDVDDIVKSQKDIDAQNKPAMPPQQPPPGMPPGAPGLPQRPPMPQGQPMPGGQAGMPAGMPQ